MSETEAQTIPFFRDTMLPPAPPPTRETGAIRWLRENLLSGPLNIILTVVVLWLLWLALSHVVPWAFRGIWHASNLNECRAIRDQLYGPDASVACWAVLSDRWKQLVFGFYPQDQLWRPPLALLVFLLAVAPVLFQRLPRRLTWLLPAAPFLIFWLIWGGPIWRPILAALGLGLGVLAFLALAGRGLRALGVLAGILVPILFWTFLQGPLTAALAGVAPLALKPVKSADIGGFTLSTIIGLSGITLSLPFGILLALARRSHMPLISRLAVGYIEVIRGVPLIVWLFVAKLILLYFLPKGTDFDLTLKVIIMVTLFSAAYIAEVIRGGLAAVPKGQVEAADAMGLDYWQAMRLVVLPQALRISIPGIVNSFIGLFKDTTLVSIISMFDPIRIAATIRATTDWGGIYWELYVFIALVFFVFCFSMSRYSIWLEHRLERDRRR